MAFVLGIAVLLLHGCYGLISPFNGRTNARDPPVVRSTASAERIEVQSVCAGIHYSAFKGNVVCVNSTASIFIGHCLGYIDTNLSKDLDVEYQGFVLTRCPFFAGSKTQQLFVTMMPPPHVLHIDQQNTSQINNKFCSEINGSHRRGLLCGQCEENFGVNLLSQNYECKNCTKNQPLALNYLKLFAVTFLPLTIFYIVVIIFHIGLTTAPTNGYILFCHLLTLKLNVLIVESAWANTNVNIVKYLSTLLFYPLYIWNLDFAFYLPDKACFGKELKIMHIISMQYFYAVYPMLLLVVTLVVVKLHARNCKPIVLLWKPFCYLCVRFRRNWNIRTSLIDAFASFLLLSYSKLMDVSLALVNPNPVYGPNGNTVYTTLHYDIETRYLSKDHLPFFVLAVIILLLFGVLSPMLLIFYPFRWFQKIVNTLHLNKVQSLHIFLDAFQGSYKNGTNGHPERRYFAGFYFIYRIIVIFVTSFGYTSIQGAVAIVIVVNALFLCSIAIFQPYKNNFYNVIDACTFLVLVVTGSNSLYLMSYAQLRGKLPNGIWPLTYAMLLLPPTYMTLYILYWILTRFRARCCQRWFMHRIRRNWRLYTGNDWTYTPLNDSEIISQPTSSSEQYGQIDNITDSLPDRLKNPYRYITRNSALCMRERIGSAIDPMEKGELTQYGAATY